MATIFLEGKKYSYSIIKKPISSLRLRLKSSSSFIVSCPRLIPEFVVNRFIKKNQLWIVRHSSKISSPKLLKKLKKLVILDEDYQLVFVPTQRDSVIIYPHDKKIYANISKDTNKHIKAVLEKKLRQN